MTPSTMISPWTYPFMTQRYPSFQTLWKPQWLPSLFIVRLPQEIQTLDEKTYLALMQTRLDRMIQQSAQATSLKETQTMLASSLEQLDSAQTVPLLEDNDLDTWRQQWSETLILNSWRFQEQLRHYGLAFPVTDLILPSHPEFLDWQALHDDTPLEDWLVTLTP